MMSTIKLTNIIPKISEHFPFEIYLEEKGYVNNKDLNVKDYKGFIKKDEQNVTQDIIFLTLDNNKHYHYYSFNHKDHGNAIDFVKNRVSNEDVLHDHSALITACRIMLIFMNEQGTITPSNSLVTGSKHDFDAFIKNSFSSYYPLSPITDFSYFGLLGINKETVEHPLFEGTVFNAPGLTIKDKKNNTKKTLSNIINTCFLMYDHKEHECGLNYSNFLYADENNTNQELNIFAPFSNQDKGVWFSNEIDFIKGRRKTKLVLVNHPAEAIAHFYIHQDLQNYASYFDMLSSENIKTIVNHVKLNNLEITLASPNKKENLLDDLRLICAFLNDKYVHFSHVENQRIYINIEQLNTPKNELVELLRSIEKLNKSVVMNTVKILGDSSRKYLQEDLVKYTKTAGNIIVLNIPYSYTHLYKFIKNILRTYPSPYLNKMDKTEHIHWRKASQYYYNTLHKSNSINQLVELF